MKAGDAKELFRQLTAEFFPKAVVIFANQSRVAKPKHPLVVLSPGPVTRSRYSCDEMIDETIISHYRVRQNITVDLFTNGEPVKDDNGAIVGREDNAQDCLLAFANFLSSEYVAEWTEKRNVAVTLEGDVQQMTGIVNDTNYQYRARMNVLFDFILKAVDKTAVLDESSIVYDSGEEYPFPTTSSTGEFKQEDEDAYKASVAPVYNDKSICGSAELAAERNGVFEDAEITDIKEDRNE